MLSFLISFQDVNDENVLVEHNIIFSDTSEEPNVYIYKMYIFILIK